MTTTIEFKAEGSSLTDTHLKLNELAAFFRSAKLGALDKTPDVYGVRRMHADSPLKAERARKRLLAAGFAILPNAPAAPEKKKKKSKGKD